MASRSPGNALILAGLIVTVIGLGVVLVQTFALPRSWIVVLVGLVLLGAGLARRALRGRDGR